MNKQLKLITAFMIATTIVQLQGMNKLAHAFAAARSLVATRMASVRAAATRLAPKFSITAASPAKIIASKLLQNNAQRLALGTMASGTMLASVPSSNSQDAKDQISSAVQQGPTIPKIIHNSSDEQTYAAQKELNNCWNTKAPSLAQHEDPSNALRPIYLTIDHLKREANTYYKDSSRYCLVAPLSLKNALLKLTPEQEWVINKYHQAIVDDAPMEKRLPLKRNVELLVRDEEERTEILDNMRWLQKYNDIGRVSYSGGLCAFVKYAVCFGICFGNAGILSAPKSFAFLAFAEGATVASDLWFDGQARNRAYHPENAFFVDPLK